MTGASSGRVIFQNCRQARGAVHRGGLVEVLRDLAQAGEEDDHRRAELPDREHDEGRERVVGVRDPGRPLDADEREELVDQALGAEDLAPEHRDRDRGAEQRRQVEGGAVDADAADAAVEHHREAERGGELQRHRPEHVGEGDAERVAQPLVVEERVGVVAEPGPARRGQQVVVGEGEIERGERRPERQAEEADQPGQQEEVAGGVPAQAAPETLAERGRRAPPAAGFSGDRHRRSGARRGSRRRRRSTSCAPSSTVTCSKAIASQAGRSARSSSPAFFGGGGGSGPTEVATMSR